MKRIIHIADLHRKAGEEDHPSWLLAKKFIKSFKPDIIVNHGDHLDFDYLGRWVEDDEEARWNKLLKNDFDLLKKDFDFLQRHSKQLIFIEGNHDNRVEKVIKKFPFLRGSLDFKIKAEIDKRNIPFQPIEEGAYKLGKLGLIHGWYFNIHHAKKHVEEYGGNIAYGHTHQLQTYIKRLPAQDSEIGGFCIPCLTDKDPKYFAGKPNRHVNGIGVTYMQDSGAFNLTQIKFDVHTWSFIFEGKQFKL